MSYTAQGGCTNCGKEFTLEIPQGVSRIEYEKTAKCKFCGVEGHIWSKAN